MTSIHPHSTETLFDRLEEIRERIESAEHIGVFTDFDGTVSRIVPVPGDAELDAEIRPILKALSGKSDLSVGVFSGRAVDDIQQRTDIEGLIYVGNHGLEIEAGNTRFREPKAEALRRELKCVSLQLKHTLADIEGLEIEDKGLTLSVHFRRVNEALHTWVRNASLDTVSKSRSFVAREGKKVIEVRPQVGWNKGHALKWLLKEVLPASSLPIYIGDDKTDEDAFAAIPQGITIRVGGTPENGTAAQYVLPDVPSVGRFLDWLNHAKSNASLASSKRAGK